MTHPEKPGRQSLALTLWLLPIVFIIHDAEELFTMPGWIAAHQQELDRLAGMSETAAKLVRSLPTTTTQTGIAIGSILLVFLVVTAGAAMPRKRGFWILAYAGLLGGLFLHVFTHIAQALLTGGYVPGLAGASAAVIPGTLYIYKRLFDEKILSPKSAALTALAGLAFFIPGAMLAHQVGRMLSGG